MNINYKESLNEKSDKYLLEMILIKQEQYEPTALKIAEQILIERKINIKDFENDLEFIGNSIKKQSIEREEEKNKAELTLGFIALAGGVALAVLSHFIFGQARLGFVGLAIFLYGLFTIIKYYVQKRKLK